RQAGDPARLAQALIDHASTVAELGYLEEARAAMDEAAAVHRQLGHAVDEAMCMQFAAALSRLAGDLDGARARAAYSLQVIPPDHALVVTARRELGEVALLAEDGVGAAQEFTQAIDQARALHLSDIDIGNLLDRRARAFVVADLPDDALADLDVAQ